MPILVYEILCIGKPNVPRDLSIWPPVTTKPARRFAEVASMRFLRERIRPRQRAKGNMKKDFELTAHKICSFGG